MAAHTPNSGRVDHQQLVGIQDLLRMLSCEASLNGSLKAWRKPVEFNLNLRKHMHVTQRLEGSRFYWIKTPIRRHIGNACANLMADDAHFQSLIS